MENYKFTYDYYEKIIMDLISSGYTITNYHNFKDAKKPCILRHDVDYDISKALEFCTRESKIAKDISATYFILLSSDFYNVFSKDTLSSIDKIISFGHEIGLHFDETKYFTDNDRASFIEYVEEELYILGKALGTTIHTVSMHRPSKHTLKSNYEFNGAINSYSKEFFENFKYVSDSRMNWREDILKIIKSSCYEKLHILTHPFWYNEKEEDINEKITCFISHATIDRFSSLTKNFTNLSDVVGEANFLRKI